MRFEVLLILARGVQIYVTRLKVHEGSGGGTTGTAIVGSNHKDDKILPCISNEHASSLGCGASTLHLGSVSAVI